jgi:toxin FitB
VRGWLDEQAVETLYLTAVSLSELLLGVEVLPDGRRKRGLRTGLAELIDELFGARILAFDGEAAAVYASLAARARRAGRPLSVADGQIAAIAALHGFSVATRDAQPFRDAGVPVIDPWRWKARE